MKSLILLTIITSTLCIETHEINDKDSCYQDNSALVEIYKTNINHPIHIGKQLITCDKRVDPQVCRLAMLYVPNYISGYFDTNKERMVFKPSKVTKNGQTYRLNPDIYCKEVNIDGKVFVDKYQCNAIIQPIHEFTFLGVVSSVVPKLLIFTSLLLILVFVVYSILNMCSICKTRESRYGSPNTYQSYRSHRDYSYHSDNDNDYSSNILDVAVGSAILAGLIGANGIFDGCNNEYD